MIKVIERIFIVFLVYVLALLCYFFVFSNKLTSEEYKEINNVYSEMRIRQNDIKNELYVNKLIRLIDKKIVMDELRLDAFRYFTVVNENAFNMLLKGRDSSYVYNYVDRCNIDFSKLMGLEFMKEAFNLDFSYLFNYTESVENIEIYAQNLDKIVEPIQEQIESVKRERMNFVLIVVISFVFVNVLWAFLIKKKKK